MKIRFNLSRGENYKKWVVYNKKEKIYIDPKKYNLSLFKCKLKNNSSKAKKIFNGENKEICAWIEFEKIKIYPSKKIELKNRLRYNPKIKPFWTNEKEENLDGIFFEKIETYDTMMTTQENK